jgi:hypothetical protein
MCDLPTSAQILPTIPPSQDDSGPSSALSDAVKVTESQGARSVAADVPVEVPMRKLSSGTSYGNRLTGTTGCSSPQQICLMSRVKWTSLCTPRCRNYLSSHR